MHRPLLCRYINDDNDDYHYDYCYNDGDDANEDNDESTCVYINALRSVQNFSVS